MDILEVVPCHLGSTFSRNRTFLALNQGEEEGEERKRVVYVRFSSDVDVGDWKVNQAPKCSLSYRSMSLYILLAV